MKPKQSPSGIDQLHVVLDYFHTDHLRWRNELEFARQELGMYNSRLEQLVVRTINKETLADIEHFQNQFIRERDVIDTLLHHVGLAIKDTATLAQDPGTLAGHFDMQKHLKLGDEMVMFSRLNADLRYSFNKFLLSVFRENVAENQ